MGHVQGMTKLEVEVTNLAAKAGKGTFTCINYHYTERIAFVNIYVCIK